MLNWSGMRKTYWIPHLEWNRDKELWYVGFKFLRLQVCLYSVEMAKYVVDRIMKGL